MRDYDELKRLALAATPGPWACEGSIQNEGSYGSGDDVSSGFTSYEIFKDGKRICDTSNSDLIEVAEEEDEDCHYAWDKVGLANGRFIAAANPAAILELLAELEQAKAVVKESLIAAPPAGEMPEPSNPQYVAGFKAGHIAGRKRGLQQAKGDAEQIECTCSAKDMPFGRCCKAPPLRDTDKWESGRVADYNKGWNDCCAAIDCARALSQTKDKP